MCVHASTYVWAGGSFIIISIYSMHVCTCVCVSEQAIQSETKRVGFLHLGIGYTVALVFVNFVCESWIFCLCSSMILSPFTFCLYGYWVQKRWICIHIHIHIRWKITNTSMVVPLFTPYSCTFTPTPMAVRLLNPDI